MHARRLCLLAVPLLVNCAGAHQEVSFTSTPPGATVTIGTVQVMTPATVVLPLGTEHVARFELAGYQTMNMALEREFTWVEEATYTHTCWCGRLPMTRTELDLFFLPYRLLVGTAWRFYPEISVSLVPKQPDGR